MSSLTDAAEWLKSSVGEGGVFTKEELRAAFPGVTQIDRRVRDLRKRGFVIHTRREDARLTAAEMRLVKIGDASRAPTGIPPEARREALNSSAYACMICGADGGGTYVDDPLQKVTLSVLDISALDRLIVACVRCKPSALRLHSHEIEESPEVDQAARLSRQDWAAACRMRLRRRLQG
jgi:hypothetical protein